MSVQESAGPTERPYRCFCWEMEARVPGALGDQGRPQPMDTGVRGDCSSSEAAPQVRPELLAEKEGLALIEQGEAAAPSWTLEMGETV